MFIGGWQLLCALRTSPLGWAPFPVPVPFWTAPGFLWKTEFSLVGSENVPVHLIASEFGHISADATFDPQLSLFGFCGLRLFEHRFPLAPNVVSRWRCFLKISGDYTVVRHLLSETDFPSGADTDENG